MRAARAVAAGCVLALSVAAPVARAGSPPTTAPAVETDAVRYSPTAAGGGDRAATQTAAAAASDLSHVVAGLAIVVGLILGLRWAARRMKLVPHAGGAGRSVRLLNRTVLSPKQQVLVLQVGPRVIVVGDSATGGMRPLCEFTNPDEVAALIGESKAANAPPPARSFGTAFRRASAPFADDPEDAPALPPDRADVPGEVAGLLDKVRGLRRQFER